MGKAEETNASFLVVKKSKSLKGILNYLAAQKEQRFTGSVKFSFENSSLVSLIEANEFEANTSPVLAEFSVPDFFNDKMDRGYNGAVILVFRQGEVTEYGWLRTFKGNDLQNLMSNVSRSYS